MPQVDEFVLVWFPGPDRWAVLLENFNAAGWYDTEAEALAAAVQAVGAAPGDFDLARRAHGFRRYTRRAMP